MSSTRTRGRSAASGLPRARARRSTGGGRSWSWYESSRFVEARESSADGRGGLVAQLDHPAAHRGEAIRLRGVVRQVELLDRVGREVEELLAVVVGPED